MARDTGAGGVVMVVNGSVDVNGGCSDSGVIKWVLTVLVVVVQMMVEVVAMV